MKKALLVGLQALVLLALAAPASAGIRLTRNNAERYMRAGLHRQFGTDWQYGYARRVKCNERVSAIRVRCEVSWILGDLAFSGRGPIWVSFESDEPFWNYAYRIKRLNEYCVAIGGKHCSKMFVVR